jgi:glycosyltransferase involved in cell wall biosynthesis
MKLLHTISASDVFGPEKTVINECLALQEAGWTAGVINFWDTPDTPIAGKMRAAGVDYQCFQTAGKLDFAAIRRLADTLKRWGRPVVHSHGYKADLYTLLAARWTRTPVLTTVHGWTSENPRVRLYEKLQARLWRYFDQVVCVSESYRAVAQRTGTPAQRLVVVHNGIRSAYRASEHPPEQARAQARALLGLDALQPVVAIVGRLGIEKDHRLFVAAAARLRDEFPDARFLIVGEGEQREALQQQVAALGLQQQVQLLGHRNDVPALYPAFDLLAITSQREGLPNVLLEAMLHGVPAVSTAVGGVPEVIDHGRNGWLVQPGQLDALVEGIATLWRDAPRRGQMAQAAVETVRRRFLFDSRMQRMMALYSGLAASRPGMQAARIRQTQDGPQGPSCVQPHPSQGGDPGGPAQPDPSGSPGPSGPSGPLRRGGVMRERVDQGSQAGGGWR